MNGALADLGPVLGTAFGYATTGSGGRCAQALVPFITTCGCMLGTWARYEDGEIEAVRLLCALCGRADVGAELMIAADVVLSVCQSCKNRWAQ